MRLAHGGVSRDADPGHAELIIEQLQFLKAQGCDIAQGFYISKPMNIIDYREWLERWPYGVEGATRLEDFHKNMSKASGSDAA